MKKNKMTAEKFFEKKVHHVVHKGHPALVMLSTDAVEYGNLRAEEAKTELLEELVQGDAKTYIENSLSHIFYSDTGVRYMSANRINIDINDLMHALSIQSAKHRKEIEEIKKKAVKLFKSNMILMCQFRKDKLCQCTWTDCKGDCEPLISDIDNFKQLLEGGKNE